MTPKSIIALQKTPDKEAVGMGVLVQHKYSKRLGILTRFSYGGLSVVFFDDGPWLVFPDALKLYPGHDILLNKCYGQSPWSWHDELTVRAGKLALKRIWERVDRPKGTGRPAAFRTLGRSDRGSLL